MTIIPTSQVFDQLTLERMLEHDPVVQFYQEFFTLLDWSVVPDCAPDPHRPGKRRSRPRAPMSLLGAIPTAAPASGHYRLAVEAGSHRAASMQNEMGHNFELLDLQLGHQQFRRETRP